MSSKADKVVKLRGQLGSTCMFGTTKIAAFGATLDSVGSRASNSCRCKKLGTAISGCSPVFDVVSEDLGETLAPRRMRRLPTEPALGLAV
jgi:hypothetical protein